MEQHLKNENGSFFFTQLVSLIKVAFMGQCQWSSLRDHRRGLIQPSVTVAPLFLKETVLKPVFAG